MASDWAREGLLDGLEESARKRRVRLLDELESAGCGREEIRRAAADERLSLLLVDRTLGGQPEYDARTLAERSGAELDFLVRVQQAMGRAVPDLDEPAFDQGDLDAAELLVQLRATGIGEEGLLEVTRVLGRALNQGADAIRGVFERAFVEAGVPEDQFAQRNARLATAPTRATAASPAARGRGGRLGLSGPTRRSGATAWPASPAAGLGPPRGPRSSHRLRARPLRLGRAGAGWRAGWLRPSRRAPD